MGLLTGPLAHALQRGRESFNATFAAACKADGRIDADAFSQHLAQALDPIVRAVAQEFPEKVDSATALLYALSLDLFSSALLGPQAKYPAVPDAWQRLLPRLPRLIAREPHRVAGAVTNAVYNLIQIPGAQPLMWIDGMIELAGCCVSTEALLDCGKVLAWRAGMVQYRDGALAAARQMDAAVAARALGLPASTPQAALLSVLDRLSNHPWITPAEALAGGPDLKRLRVAGQAGAFRGSGGSFIRPPIVACQDGHLLISDGQFTWMLLADVHGVVLYRIADEPLAPGDRLDHVKLDRNGAVRWGEASATLPELAEWSSAACDGCTLAVTLPTSHHVFLVGRG